METLPMDIIKKILWYLDTKSYVNMLCVSKLFYKNKLNLDLSNFMIDIPKHIKYLKCSSILLDFIEFNNVNNLILNDYNDDIDIEHKFDVVKLIDTYYEYINIDCGINTNTLIHYDSNIDMRNSYIKNLYCKVVHLRVDLDYLECNLFTAVPNIKINTLRLINDNFLYDIVFPKINKLIFVSFDRPFRIVGIKNIKNIIFEKCSEKFIMFNMPNIIEKKIPVSFSF